ncbi:hypothetical protein L9F63_002433, partial [Diploptera punctata]
ILGYFLYLARNYLRPYCHLRTFFLISIVSNILCYNHKFIDQWSLQSTYTYLTYVRRPILKINITVSLIYTRDHFQLLNCKYKFGNYFFMSKFLCLVEILHHIQNAEVASFPFLIPSSRSLFAIILSTNDFIATFNVGIMLTNKLSLFLFLTMLPLPLLCIMLFDWQLSHCCKVFLTFIIRPFLWILLVFHVTPFGRLNYYSWQSFSPLPHTYVIAHAAI